MGEHGREPRRGLHDRLETEAEPRLYKPAISKTRSTTTRVSMSRSELEKLLRSVLDVPEKAALWIDPGNSHPVAFQWIDNDLDAGYVIP